MKKHIKIYLKYFDYGEQDFIPSEVSGGRAADIHHIIFRSHGGKDEIENLIALTRAEHELAHNNPTYNEKLKEIHRNKIDAWKGNG